MRIALWMASALIAVAGVPVGAQVLTLDDARRLALENQPALRALEHAARAAQHGSVADSALPDSWQGASPLPAAIATARAASRAPQSHAASASAACASRKAPRRRRVVRNRVRRGNMDGF